MNAAFLFSLSYFEFVQGINSQEECQWSLPGQSFLARFPAMVLFWVQSKGQQWAPAF